MYKNFVTLTAALAIASLGLLGSAQAGGGATSAPSKYSNENRSAGVDQIQRHWQVQNANYRIEEFSSSSSKSPVSKR